MSTAPLVTERRPDGSAWITLDRPEVLAFALLLLGELLEAVCVLVQEVAEVHLAAAPRNLLREL